ncbi:MAG: hypothetical protein Q7S20_02885 [Gemmatimonadaceae bacterium]|nr:hypothetical protein [Gemmatimonadaceae bacterium]
MGSSAHSALARFPPRGDDVLAVAAGTQSSRMLAAIQSAALLGIDAYDVTVEVDATPGLPQWTPVGT